MEGQDGLLVAPPIPLEAAVEALRGLDGGLDYVLDSLWDTDETRFADKIESGIHTSFNLLHKVLDDIPANEAEQRAFAANYFNGEAPDGGRRDVINYEDMESGRLVEHRLTQDEIVSGIRFIRTFLRELGDELLSFSRDEIEEVSDLVLAVARIWVQMAQGATRKVLRVLEKDNAWQEEDKQRREEERGQVIEEASDEEIAALYRRRGEEPPPPRRKLEESLPESGVGAAAAAAAASDNPSEGKGSRRRRRMRQGKPQRVLWRPLRPQLMQLVNGLPSRLRTDPLRTGGLACLALPFSGVLLFCLPGALLTDHCLQELYDRYGDSIEATVDNGKTMTKLGFVVLRLSARQGYRVVRRQMRKIEADPVNVIKDVGEKVWEGVTHPTQTAAMLYSLGEQSVTGAITRLSWMRDQVQVMRETSSSA